MLCQFMTKVDRLGMLKVGKTWRDRILVLIRLCGELFDEKGEGSSDSDHVVDEVELEISHDEVVAGAASSEGSPEFP